MRALNIIFMFTLLISFNYSTAQDESYIFRYLFASANDITKLSTDVISLGVDAVWEASGITGVVTTTGTLTQSPSNLELWTYSVNPNNKLLLNFADGSSIEFIFYAIDGYTQGDEEDFKWFHQMDFNVFVQGFLDLRINSNTYPNSGKIFWQRSITGTSLFDSQTMNVNVSHNGNIEYEIGNGFAFYTYREQATGNSSTGSFSININEQYIKKIANNSNNSTFVENTEIFNNSSGDFGGTNYQYQNVDVFWASGSVIYGSYYNKVINSNDWFVQGELYKNGQLYGTIQFDGPVLDGTYGPDLILHLNNGSNIFLHPLIVFPATKMLNENIPVSEFELFQNYPNPFNPSTKISWQSPVGCWQNIKIFDALGREIETIVDGYYESGYHSTFFIVNPTLPSGVYFYRLKAGEYTAVKKMIIMK